MEITSLAAIRWWAQALAVLLIIVCILLIILVLLQKGKGAGLAAAFGGAGGQSAFGSKTGDVFTWITIVAAVAFLLLAMIVTFVYKPVSTLDSSTQQFTQSQGLPPAGDAAAAQPAAPGTPGLTEEPTGATGDAPPPASPEPLSTPEGAPQPKDTDDPQGGPS